MIYLPSEKKKEESEREKQGQEILDEMYGRKSRHKYDHLNK